MQVNGDFTWETMLDDKKDKGKAEEMPARKTDQKKTNDEVRSRWKRSKKKTIQNLLPSTVVDSKITGNIDGTEKEEPPFSFNDLRFEVPKGAFVAIVGRVGCGKVSRRSYLSVNCVIDPLNIRRALYFKL